MDNPVAGLKLTADMFSGLTSTITSNLGGCFVTCRINYYGYYDCCIINSQNNLQIFLICNFIQFSRDF